MLTIMHPFHLILSPIKIAVLRLMHQLIPKPFPENLLDHKLIVSWSNINFISFESGLIQGKVNADTICKLHLKVKIQRNL